MSESTKLIRPLPANDIIVAAMNAKTDSSSRVTTIPAIPLEAHDDATIVSGTREKRRILEAYETKFGTGYPDSIITRKKGKLIDTTLLSPPHSRTRRMRPSKDKFYRVDILELHSIIATIIKEFRVEFTTQDISNLCLVCKDFMLLVLNITRWLTVDFSLLCEPRYNYEQQEQIDSQRIKMASAAMVHFGLDPRTFVQ